MKELINNALKIGLGAGGAVLFAAITMKVIAVYWGVAAVGIFSIYRSAYQSLVLVGTMNSQNAIMQGAADLSSQYRADYTKNISWISIFWLSFTVLVSLFVIQVIVPESFVDKISPDHIGLLTFAVLLGCVGIILGALANGFHHYGLASFAKFLGSFVGLIIALIALAFSVDIEVLTLAILLGSAGVIALFLLIFFFYKKYLTFHGFLTFPLCRASVLKPICRLSSFSFLTAIIVAVSVLAVKLLIEHYNGLVSVGLFEAAWSLSMTYTMVMLSSFGSYYLPQLTIALKNKRRLQLNVLRTLRFALIISVPAICLLQVLKLGLVIALFDYTFAQATNLLKVMLIGDYFKALAWVFSYVALAHKNLKTLLFADTSWSLLFLLGCFVLIDSDVFLESIGWLFTALYFLYLLFFYWYVRNKNLVIPKGFFHLFLYGLAIVLSVSAINWPEDGNIVIQTLSSLCLLLAYFFVAIKGREWRFICSQLKRRLPTYVSP